MRTDRVIQHRKTEGTRMIQEEIDSMEQCEKERIAYLDRVLPEIERKCTRCGRLFASRSFVICPECFIEYQKGGKQ